MKKYGLVLLPVVLFVFIILALHILNPQTVGPAGILFIFVLIYIFFLSLFTIGLYFGASILRKIGAIKTHKNINPQKAYYIASVIACFPVFLLAIMSIGELRFIDVMLIVLFVFLASFYINRRA